jgi:perosamine synthetase
MIRVGDFPLGDEERAAIQRVVDSGHISEGREVAAFEREWAAYCGTKYAVACSSGWAALVLALSCSKTRTFTIPALTYIATASAVKFSGHELAFMDVDPQTMCADNVHLPVDLMGYIAPHGGFIEDACEAHGATGVGNRAPLTCYSFYIAHNIQAGELGAVTTDSEDMYRLMKSLKAQGRACDCAVCTRGEGRCPREHDGGSDPRFTHSMWGFNFKTMEFPAALARVQIPKADEIVRKRRENMHILNQLLDGTPGITLPYEQPGMSPLAYPLILDDDRERSPILHKIGAAGVETRPLFYSIPQMMGLGGSYPVAERIGRQGFYCALHQYCSPQDLETIAAAIKGAL